MRLAASCPRTCRQNPSYRKINPADAPILILALTSDTMTVPQMYDEADSILAQKVAQVQGVGQAFVGGSAKPAVRIEANPTLLASYGTGARGTARGDRAGQRQPADGLPERRNAARHRDDHGPALRRGRVCAADRGARTAARSARRRVNWSARERGFRGDGELNDGHIHDRHIGERVDACGNATTTHVRQRAAATELLGDNIRLRRRRMAWFASAMWPR